MEGKLLFKGDRDAELHQLINNSREEEILGRANCFRFENLNNIEI